MKITSGVDRVVLMIRHSIASKAGTDANKTLASQGIQLCREVAAHYGALMHQIAEQYGDVTYCCSTFPRSAMTAWEIFYPGNLNFEECLKVRASLLAIDGGEWFKARKAEGKSESAMIREFLGDPALMTDDFREYQRNYMKFVEGKSYGTGESRTARFVIATCHEAGISLAAQGHLAAEDLGLENCEAVLFYVAGGVIIGAEKIVPNREVAPIV